MSNCKCGPTTCMREPGCPHACQCPGCTGRDPYNTANAAGVKPSDVVEFQIPDTIEVITLCEAEIS